MQSEYIWTCHTFCYCSELGLEMWLLSTGLDWISKVKKLKGKNTRSSYNYFSIHELTERSDAIYQLRIEITDFRNKTAVAK